MQRTNMIRIKLLVAPLTLLVFLTHCAEKKAKKESKPAPAASTSSEPTTDTCTALKSHGSLNQIAPNLVTRLCGGTMIQDLNTIAFSGQGEPTIKVESKDLGQRRTEMQSSSLLATSAKPKSYFNMMRLQVTQPQDFKSAGFETDAAVTYTIINTTPQQTTYRYVNDSQKPEVVVDYEATASFLSIEENSIYAVTSVWQKKYETVENLKGLVVIVKDGNGAKVYAVADQTYDNNNDHAKTLQKAQQAFKDDLKRAYRNSLNAARADNITN